MRTIVCGDIHGAHKALLQCLERSKFDFEKDTLIQLGDICDGWSEVYECVEELMKIRNLILIKGNHDDWFHDFLNNQGHPDAWVQGGEGTLKSYTRKLGFGYGGTKYHGFHTGMHPVDIPKTHIDFFKQQRNYYKDEQDNLFIHGGFNRHYLLKDHPRPFVFYWDRDLWMAALSCPPDATLKIKEPVKEVFIGHTQTTNWNTDKPMTGARIIWNVDTGAGWNGRLTFMDINTKEYWQSDPVKELYPNEKGRG